MMLKNNKQIKCICEGSINNSKELHLSRILAFHNSKCLHHLNFKTQQKKEEHILFLDQINTIK